MNMQNLKQETIERRETTREALQKASEKLFALERQVHNLKEIQIPALQKDLDYYQKLEALHYSLELRSSLELKS